MTIDEKRTKLDSFCYGDCEKCPLNPLGYCDDENWYNMSEEKINECYNIVINDEQSHAKEEINYPNKYANGKFECIDVMLDVFGADAIKHFCTLNAFKCLWESEKKNDVDDIQKAVWYLNKYIELG